MNIALDLQLTELKFLRDELGKTMDNTRGVVNLNLIALGICVTVSSSLLKLDFTDIVPLQLRAVSMFTLIAPALFYFLMLVFLRYMLLHVEITVYLNHLVDLIKETAEKNASAEEKKFIKRSLMWHKSAGLVSPLERYPWSLWLVPISPLLLPIVGALVFLVIFTFINTIGFSDFEQLKLVPWWENVLLTVNFIVSCYLIWIAKAIGSRIQVDNYNGREKLLSVKLPL